MASNNTFGNSSIRRNYAFNLINTLSGLLFPLITFPYLSRILLAEGIGKFQFFQSIIDYIILCCSLGIPLYAIREIARIRDDEKKYSITTIEILLLHGLLTLGGYIIVFILASTISIIKVDIPLFLLLSINICFNTVGVVWFYQAIEDF
ncbi:oligosaccharide flippase family protein, partial [Parabacteroides johnsonii]